MKHGSQRSRAMSTALSPDLDSLLLHIDRAVATTEYARASAFLSGIPSGPTIKSSHSVSFKQGETETVRKASRAKSLAVEKFLQDISRKDREPSISRVSDVENTIHRYSGVESPQLDLSSSKLHTFSSEPSSLKSKHELALAQGKSERMTRVIKSPDLQILAFSPRSGQILDPKIAFLTVDKRPSSPLFRLASTPIPASVKKFKPRIRASSVKADSLGEIISFDAKRRCEPEEVSREDEDLGIGTNESTLERRIAGEQESFMAENIGGQFDKSRNFDEAAADQAYRAGGAAMEEGNMTKAISLLRLASLKCPPNRSVALSRIEKLISAAAQELEMQEASRNVTQSAVPAEVGRIDAEGIGSSVSMKLLAVGDMVKADEAYRAGIVALENGEPGKALEHLKRAIEACPEDRHAAASKIETLIEQANFELKLR